MFDGGHRETEEEIMRTMWILALVVGVALAGCSGDSKQQSQSKTGETSTQAAQQVAGKDTVAKAPPAPAAQQPSQPAAREPKKALKTQAPPPVAHPPKTSAPESVPTLVSVEKGSELAPSLDETVSTETYQAGRTFTATLKAPYLVNGLPAFPAGSRVRGDVSLSKRAERVGGQAEMTLEFKEITTPDGKTYNILAQPLTLLGKGTAKGDVGKVLGGAVGGAIVGGILGGKSGAVKGGAAGSVAGAGWAVATRGNDIVLDAGTQIKVVLSRAVDVQIMAPPGTPNP
jgi:hypothetical protein